MNRFRLMPLGILLGGLALLPACKTVDSQSRVMTESASPDVASFINKMYDKYNAGYQIQDDPETPDDCASLYVPADADVKPQGTVVFFHGFTACPQQYWDLSQILKKRGYATLSVLMPGQGRGPAPFAYADRLPGQEGALKPLKEGDLRLINGRPYDEYYAEFLPKVQNGGWKTYLEFVEDVNAFVKRLPGEKMVGGLSVGGELATYAYVQSPGLYKRAILMTPYFGMPGPDLVNKFAGTELDAPGLYKIQKRFLTMRARESETFAKLPISWGRDCYEQTRGRNGKPGRRGICDYRVENLAAINSVGDYVKTLLKNKEELTEVPEVQMVGVDWDIGAGNTESRKAMGYQIDRFGPEQTSVCFYPHRVPHSFFSRKDLLQRNDVDWLDSFERRAVAFLVDGERFETDSQESSKELHYDGKAEKDATTLHARCKI